MKDTKPLWQSKTFWGGLLAVAAPIVNMTVGTNIDDQAVAQTMDVVTSAASGLGGLWAIYGRKNATTRIR